MLCEKYRFLLNAWLPIASMVITNLLYRIIAESAHSAYDKAAQYFNIKVRRVPVNKEFLADVKGFKRCINANTIMVSFLQILKSQWP